MKQYRIALVVALVLLSFASTSFAAVNNKYFRADKQYFDIETGQYVISGNIVINVENGVIAGEKALVKLSTLEFWGTGGWLLKQYDVIFKGASAYVVFGKDIAMIEGGADFQRTDLHITADKVDYNWKSKVAVFNGNVKVIQPGLPGVSSDSIKYNVETKEFVN